MSGALNGSVKKITICIVSLFLYGCEKDLVLLDKSLEDDLNFRIQDLCENTSDEKYIEIDLYSDYACPACAEVHRMVESLCDKLKCAKLNYKIITASQKSVEAAYLACEAQKEGKLEKFNKLMYNVQTTDVKPKTVANNLALNLKKLILHKDIFKKNLESNNKCVMEITSGIIPVIKITNNKTKKTIIKSGNLTTQQLVQAIESIK